MTLSRSGSRVDANAGRNRHHVFIDGRVLTVLEPSPDRRQDGRRVLAPGAAETLELLHEGHEVVVIAAEDLALVDAIGSARTSAQVPDSFPPGSWYITDDETWCEGDRPIGLRSILVGPKRPPARRPTLRCDLEARDLSAAVMEILVRETMA